MRTMRETARHYQTVTRGVNMEFRELTFPEETCANCRYRHRSSLQSPCSTGVYQMHYSRRCFAFKPSLRMMLLDWIRRLKHEL